MGLFGQLAAALLFLFSPTAIPARHDLVFAPGPRGKLDVYMPRKSPPGAPVAVFFYGGSWQSGDRGLYQFVGKILASRGIVTAIPDYRLFPEVRYPDFLRDNAAAVKFVRDHAAEWGGDPTRLFLIGHSAGAYNAVMLGLDRRWLAAQGIDPRRDIAGVVGLAGPYDFLPLRDDTLKVIFGPEDGRPDSQPINHVDGGGPPMLLLAGGGDTVVGPGNAKRLARAIVARGGEAEADIYPRVGHVGMLTALLGPFRRRAPVLDAISGFVAGRGGTTARRAAA